MAKGPQPGLYNFGKGDPKVTESAILNAKGNALKTTVTNVPTAFVQANVTSIAAVGPGYAGSWAQDPSGKAGLKYTGETAAFKLEISGSVIAGDPAFIGTYVGVEIKGSVQGAFTGGIKFYPVGVSFGASPALGFSIVVYGVVQKNEVISVSLSSNTAGDLTLQDSIYFIERIGPIGA